MNRLAERELAEAKDKKEGEVATRAEAAPATLSDLSPEGIEALASMTFDNLGNPANTPHEQLAKDLISSALEGKKTAVNLYWQLQKEIYKANAKKPHQNFKIEVKRDEILSQALDNIQSKVLEGETVNQEKVDNTE